MEQERTGAEQRIRMAEGRLYLPGEEEIVSEQNGYLETKDILAGSVN